MVPETDDAYEMPSGWTHGGEKPRIKKTYQKFNALIYSLETFVPLLALKIDKYWIPDSNRGRHIRFFLSDLVIPGTLFRCYLCLHIIAGWILTTLWIGGMTSLIKS
jgi:hypothetical protein